MANERQGENDVMDVVYLLDRLEEVLGSARRVPLSSNVMVDAQECLDIVDQVRVSLPEELKLARRVLTERDQILAEADQRSNQLVERAEREAAERVDDHSVAQAAEDRAQELLDRATREADEIRRQSDEYAHRVFSRLHDRLRQLESVVQEGLAELRPERRPGDRD